MQTNRVLTLDEMNIGKDNGNPFARFSGYGTVNTAPLYLWRLGLQYRVYTALLVRPLLRHDQRVDGSYYTRATPEAILSNNATTVTVSVMDSATRWSA